LTEAVLDASVVLKWFVPTDERGSAEARLIRDDYRAGQLVVTVPSLLFLEILNVAGRRWGWEAEALLDLLTGLQNLLFGVAEPELDAVATWVARGLTAHDGVDVALAEERGILLVSDDQAILETASGIARSLVPG